MMELFIAIRSLPAPRRMLLGVLVFVSCWAESLHASQLDFSLGYRAEYSDNITRIPEEREGQSELINTLSAQFSYLENTGTINARVLAGVAYNDFYHKTFDNQTNLSLDAYGEAFFVERTASWVAVDGFRKLQIDPLLPDTPTNRQDSNAWATGPNVYLRFGSVDTMTLEARYGRSWVESLDIDNDRHSYATRWAHKTSARTTWSLNYEYLDVDYENDMLNTDLSRHNAFLRADVRDPRTQFTVDVGRTRLERDDFEPSSDWLAHMTLSTQTGSNTNAGMHYRREYADTGGELLPSAPDQPVSGIGTGSGAQTLGADVVNNAPYYVKQVDLFYTRRGSTLPWLVQVFSRDIDYLMSPGDRQEEGAMVNVSYLYSSSVSFQLLSTYNILVFDQLMREDRESNVGITFAYRMTPNLQASLDIRRFGRRSSESGQDYTDDRFALTFMYGSRPVER